MPRPSIALAAALAAVSPATTQQLPQDWADQLHWRAIGPATMGGRIIALACTAR
jgi:hypothetical protein